MKSRIASLGLPAALLATSLFAACQNTARGVEQDAEQNAAAAREASQEAAAKAEEATRNARAAAERAAAATKEATGYVARETKEATGAVGAAIDAAQQTMQIKTALIDADNIDAAAIDVDTNGTTKTVTLKGSVPTAAQKAAAERIAKEKAPDYRVVNELTIR